jgi:hypothetical protein
VKPFVALCLCAYCILLNGCSDANQAATQVVSIASEAELFIEFVQGGHATPTYAKTHPEYLKRLAQSASEEVEKSGSQELEQEMQRLRSALDNLAATSSDLSAFNGLHEEFAEIARRAGQIGKSI